jgi:hypothetical protein
VIVPRCSARLVADGKRCKSETSCNLLSVSDFGQVIAANGARRASPCLAPSQSASQQVRMI